LDRCGAINSTPSFLQFVVQGVAVVSVIGKQVLRLGLDHVEVETELHQRHFMMIGRMCARRQRQPMARQ
jgi:hypothetical protein